MKGTEVTLSEMLECRERRAALQRQLIEKHHCPLISFSMNIPGPVKTNGDIRAAFERGKDALLRALRKHGFKINGQSEVHGATGDELILSVDAPAEELKELTMYLEESAPVGRLYDMDVLDAGGKKAARSLFRRCLVCDRPAQECARSRRHSLSEMQKAVEHLLGTEAF